MIIKYPTFENVDFSFDFPENAHDSQISNVKNCYGVCVASMKYIFSRLPLWLWYALIVNVCIFRAELNIFVQNSYFACDWIAVAVLQIQQIRFSICLYTPCT